MALLHLPIGWLPYKGGSHRRWLPYKGGCHIRVEEVKEYPLPYKWLPYKGGP